MTTVTTVIPAYNAARTIGDTLEAALQQTHPDHEIIVVDDGSTDGTAEIVASVGRGVRCLRTPNRGVSQARNLGISEARGDYIALLDADDLWLPEKVAKQVALLDADPDLGLVYTAIQIIDDDLRPIRVVPAVQRDDYTEAFLHQCDFAISSVMVRRDVIVRAGSFHPWFSQCADWDCWLRLSGITRFAPIDEPLVLYRAAAGNMSRNVPLLEDDSFAVFESFYAHRVDERYRRLRRWAYGHNWEVLAGSYWHAGRPLDTARCLVRAAVAHPASLGHALAFPARRLRRR